MVFGSYEAPLLASGLLCSPPSYIWRPLGLSAVRFSFSASRDRNCLCRLCRVRSVAVDYLRDLPWVCLGLASFTRKIVSHGKNPEAKVADVSICSLCQVHILNSDPSKDTYTAVSGNAQNVGVVSC